MQAKPASTSCKISPTDRKFSSFIRQHPFDAARLIEGICHVRKKPFQNGKSEMDTRSLVLDCALPAEPGETRKAALLRAARNSGLTFARVCAFFYGKGNPPLEAREKLIEAASIRRAWADIQMDQRLAELTAARARLKADVERMDREIAAALRNGRDGGRGSYRPDRAQN